MEEDHVSPSSRRAALAALVAIAATATATTALAGGGGERPKPKNPSRNNFKPRVTDKDVESKRKRLHGEAEVPTENNGGENYDADPIILDRISRYFGLSSSKEMNSQKLLAQFRPLDQWFSYSPTSSGFAFNHFQVEALLSTAAQYLELSLRDINVYQEKAALAANIGLEMLHFARLDAVHRAEEASGYYDVMKEAAEADRVSETLSMITSSNAEQNINEFIQSYYTLDKINQQLVASQLVSWLGPLPHFDEPMAGAELMFSGESITPKTASEHFKDSAFDQSLLTLLAGQLQLGIQADQHQLQKLSSEAKLQARYTKEKWEKADVGFKKARTKIARNLAKIKLEAATELNGPLNFVAQLGPIRERVIRNFSDAIARIICAKRGLDELYGFPIDFPSELQKLVSQINSSLKPEEDQFGVFDAALIWVRNAQAWLDAIYQHEQSYVYTISLRATVGEQLWRVGLSKSEWGFELSKFDFPEQNCVRLKGVSCCIDGGVSYKDIWLARLTIPQHANHTTLDGREVKLSQTHIKSFRVGRIQSRNDMREPDIVGVVSLHNGSPIGNWTIALSKKGRSGADSKSIDDLYIDLHIGFFSRSS
jgi:hypothetical protein